MSDIEQLIFRVILLLKYTAFGFVLELLAQFGSIANLPDITNLFLGDLVTMRKA